MKQIEITSDLARRRLSESSQINSMDVFTSADAPRLKSNGKGKAWIVAIEVPAILA